MQFEWDDQKNQANKKKHGVSFELATLVFGDPHAVSVPNDCQTEERWLTMGLVKAVLVIVVAHTVGEDQDHEEIVRIISARKAKRAEREEYENQYRKT